MKKIMLNDKYGLTSAVLEGRKTMTRRIVKNANLLQWLNELDDDGALKSIKGKILSEENSAYKVGEIVAVAQSYESMANGGYLNRMTVPADNAVGFEFKLEYCGGGYKNKMFVAADLMPHRIRITDIKVERLQDISDEDCLKEGIIAGEQEPRMFGFHLPKGTIISFLTPRNAFAAIIDKVSGKGTWERNPWVFVYSFKLID